MTRSQRRLLLLVAAVPVLVLLSAIAYMWGMERLEGEPRGFWHSLGWAGETLTTTGYGGDAHWRHPGMVIFVVVVQFIGVFLVFLIFPIYLIPFHEERFEARLPTRARKLAGHVVVYRYGPAVATLIDQLEEAGVRTLVVEQDEPLARRVADRGRRVIVARLEDGALEAACLGEARALIANDADAENAAVILAARQEGFTGDVLALVEEPVHRRPLVLAGATAVFTPRHILGAALAARASDRISPRVAGVQQVGEKLLVQEMRIGAGSPLAGVTLREAGLGAKTGATAIGQWVGGELISPLTGDTRLRAKGILVAEEGLVGRHPTDLDIRQRTGCSVVAVERGDEVLVEFPSGFRFEQGDAVYVSGAAGAVNRFEKGLERG